MSTINVPEYSVVIPVYNELGSLRLLLDQLLLVLREMGSHEVIFVDDGSTDGSERLLESLHREHPLIVKLIIFRCNMGKATALSLGFHAARGRFVVMMDADLQDQPQEIPNLVKKLHQDNLDVVTGWKKYRQDPLNKTLPSIFFNFCLRKVFSVDVHDFNCGLKLMRAECAQSLFLYGQLHRYVLIMLASQGFRVGEVPVSHSPRTSGVSKYGGRRFLEGFLDMITIFFLTRYLKAPLYFFGYYAVAFLLLSIIIGGYFLGVHFYAILSGSRMGLLADHPLWIVSPVLFLASVIFFFFGLLGQMILHFHLQKNNQAHVRLTRGLDEPQVPSP